ncbi:MAG: HIT domain-containing protein [Propionibacteriaceae bacterium]|jgi:histidine triad (HIT) family protein|nr:HIT domain-containing protein [Propionibacteriaceae bacterium]
MTDTDCLFCRIVAGAVPSHQVWSDDQAVAFLDINPLHLGHTLVIPRRHVADGTGEAAAWADVAEGLAAVASAAKARLGATGVNFLANSGKVAGQEVFHFHVHVIPRYDATPGMGGLLRRDSTAASDLAGTASRLRA